MRMHRRRFIRIAATCVAGLGLRQSALAALGGSLRPVSWRGYALGAEGGFTLYTEDPPAARAVLERCFAEIRRLESFFSLYDNHSELCRLNREGRLDAPAAEWADLLAVADHAHRMTGGLFDPTVQALWKCYDEHFRAYPDSVAGPDVAVIEAARARTGWEGLVVEKGAIAFTRPGMQLTLNGIAQGYITDRVTDILRGAGFPHVLVELGETRAIGRHPGGRPWSIGIKHAADPAALFDRVELEDQALATSGAYGSPFSRDGAFHHLIHPQSGRPEARWQSVSVIAPTAAEADALSTGLSFADGALVEAVRASGLRVVLQ